MRLTYHTDYALRVLVYLAVNTGKPTRVSDVADSYGISRNHLLKVTHSLGRLGYMTTLRGRSGGIALARQPEEINLGDVVRNMEDEFTLVECMRLDGGECVISPACRLKGVVRKALEAFLSVFDDYSLADLARNRDSLAGLLAFPGSSLKPA